MCGFRIFVARFSDYYSQIEGFRVPGFWFLVSAVSDLVADGWLVDGCVPGSEFEVSGVIISSSCKSAGNIQLCLGLFGPNTFEAPALSRSTADGYVQHTRHVNLRIVRQVDPHSRKKL